VIFLGEHVEEIVKKKKNSDNTEKEGKIKSDCHAYLSNFN
jgi:hypothetical protein